MALLLPLLFAAAGGLWLFRGRALRYLKYFQQEEYNGRRFLDWYRRQRAFDRRASLVCLGGLALTLILSRLAPGLPTLVGWLAAALVLAWLPRWEPDPRSDGKPTLKLTPRARRIWQVAMLVYGLALLLGAWLHALLGADLLPGYWLTLILLVQATPAFLVLANRLLTPYENRLQHGFIQEAKGILAKVRPTVIGITGSYGKTSTKAILGACLETRAPTFWPPKSINTPMGIVREIRERLQPGFRFAIIEMGAYGVGSIRRLCELTPPQVAVITNVGAMHLERFGNLDNIYRAKSELAQALPSDGILVCNNDNPGARRMAAEFARPQTLLYGLEDSDPPPHCRMSHIRLDPEGVHFLIHWEGESYPGFTRLLGRPMLSNVLAAFTAACALGAHPVALLAAIRSLEPQPHRLAPRREDGLLILDDSYNANPVGFAAALEVLAAMPGERKFLITPGMIELGPLQEQENHRLAALAATLCDQVLVVGETNRRAFETGLGDKPGLYFPSFAEADRYLRSQARAGDVVLWENDLPDLYQETPRF